MAYPRRGSRRGPLLATAFSLLFVASQALDQAGRSDTGFFRYAVTNRGAHSEGAVLGLVAGTALIGVGALCEDRVLSRFGRATIVVAGALMLALNAIRGVAPQYDYNTLDPYGQAIDTVVNGLLGAALLALGISLLDAVVRSRGLALIVAAAGATSLIAGVLLTPMLAAIDQGLAFGVSVAGVLLGLTATASWGLLAGRTVVAHPDVGTDDAGSGAR